MTQWCTYCNPIISQELDNEKDSNNNFNTVSIFGDVFLSAKIRSRVGETPPLNIYITDNSKGKDLPAIEDDQTKDRIINLLKEIEFIRIDNTEIIGLTQGTLNLIYPDKKVRYYVNETQESGFLSIMFDNSVWKRFAIGKNAAHRIAVFLEDYIRQHPIP